MGWDEQDDEVYEITEDDKREFKQLTDKVWPFTNLMQIDPVVNYKVSLKTVLKATDILLLIKIFRISAVLSELVFPQRSV